MTIKRIEPGKRMSGAVVHGNTVYLAGQVGEGTSVTEQSKSALAEVDRLLAAAGSDKSCRRSSISPTCPPSAK
jgi:enamine deaminase RidA (YjgF/YER057c/UK114 family)